MFFIKNVDIEAVACVHNLQYSSVQYLNFSCGITVSVCWILDKFSICNGVRHNKHAR